MNSYINIERDTLLAKTYSVLSRTNLTPIWKSMAVYQKKNKTLEVVKNSPPPYVGLASDVLPEAQSNDNAESSRTGVSTNCALSGTNIRKPVFSEIYKKRREENMAHPINQGD